MATTDSRTGFRLPWSTDRSASREASAEPAESVDGIASEIDETDLDGAAPPPSEAPEASGRETTGDSIPIHEEEQVTTFAPDVVSSHAPAGATTLDPGAKPRPSAASAPATRAGVPAHDPGRRPSKFLADLTRAMQAAAEQARAGTLEQFRAEGTTVIEQIHARSATGATELRRHADDDVATIKEWSKAEIARVREETEQRVASRREQLDGQLERHAALIEHEIEKVRGRVSTFETDMGTFFDELLQEEDPSTFAARAASIPEPPSFEDLDDDAMVALLREPGVGVPAAAVAPEPEIDASPEPAEPAAAIPDALDADGSPLDRETAMAAIQAAAEAAASLEAAEGHADRAEAAADRAEAVAPPDAPLPGEPGTAADPDTELDAPAEPAPGAEVVGEVAADGEAAIAVTDEALPVDEPVAEPATEAEPELDPRLAMLGLTPDFAVAEMEAAEAAAAAADLEEMPEMGGDALAARLSGLVPSADTAPAPAVATTSTQIVVTGLVSVASIASFKRHLGRLAGVAHVGVSSGPDGEFVFAVEHDPATSLRDLVPTLPGFGARVVGTGDGIVHVSAQDPQD